MTKIYNLTQHNPTPSQVEAGVQDPLEGAKELLNFDAPGVNVEKRAKALAVLLAQQWAKDTGAAALPIMTCGPEGPKVMIGGIPRLMGPLERALTVAGFRPIYAFSRRECVETQIAFGPQESSWDEVAWPEGWALQEDEDGLGTKSWSTYQLTSPEGKKAFWGSYKSSDAESLYGDFTAEELDAFGVQFGCGVKKEYVFRHVGFDEAAYCFVPEHCSGYGADGRLRNTIHQEAGFEGSPSPHPADNWY